MKIPHTITFYLTTEYALELDRIAKFSRTSPQQWCKSRTMSALQRGMDKK